jgi:hypothetical protein
VSARAACPCREWRRLFFVAEGEALSLLGESGSGEVAVTAKLPDSRTAEMSGAPLLHNLPPRESPPRTRESSVPSPTTRQPDLP